MPGIGETRVQIRPAAALRTQAVQQQAMEIGKVVPPGAAQILAQNVMQAQGALAGVEVAKQGQPVQAAGQSAGGAFVSIPE